MALKARFFFFFGRTHEACGILVPQPGIERRPSAVKAQGPNHWTTREFPRLVLKNGICRLCLHFLG